MKQFHRSPVGGPRANTTIKTNETSLKLLARLVWRHLRPIRRWQLGGLLVLMLCNSLAELVTVASLVPFLMALSDPGSLWNNEWARRGAEVLGYDTDKSLALVITVVLMLMCLISAAVRSANLFASTRLSGLIGSDLAVEGFRRTLEQPYDVHIRRNSSEVITQLRYLEVISRGVITPVLQGISGLTVSIALVAGLLSYQPAVAMLLSAILLVSYGGVIRVNRQRLNRISKLSNQYSQCALKVQQEGLGAIRDVILDHNEDMYVDTYLRAERPLMLLQAQADTLAGLPRFALEGAGMIAIAGAVLYLITKGGINAALPAVGAIALGFQRLLPAVQQIYGAFTHLGAYKESLAGGLNLLEQTRSTDKLGQLYTGSDEKKVIRFEKSLKLTGITFSHQMAEAPVLKGIGLTIQKGEWIGIVGPTGSGKSTLLDIMMGLLLPTHGSICIDGLQLEDSGGLINRRKAWQLHLAHVPQTIFLADTSIAANIAFSENSKEIDNERLIWAASSAQALNFITSLPEGFDTIIGERGVRLSGGQRQRLGIARALYKEADVLILDEATSALDATTEQSVINSLWNLGRERTVVMVAHRISTLQRCQKIVELRSGIISGTMTYAELLKSRQEYNNISENQKFNASGGCIKR